jgi:hypothetical protein
VDAKVIKEITDRRAAMLGFPDLRSRPRRRQLAKA